MFDANKLAVFAQELTILCRRHGLGIGGEPTLFVMEYEDQALQYVVDGASQLVLT